MKLRRLRKAEDSHPDRKCPAIYLADDPLWMVSQGKLLSDAVVQELEDRADDESGVLIPTETVVRSVCLLLAEAGRPDLAGEVETVLVVREPSRS